MVSMATGLSEAGLSDDAVEIATLAQSQVRRLAKEWATDPQGNGAGRNIRTWAVTQLADQVHLEEESDILRQAKLLALARYAQLSQEETRRYLEVVASFVETEPPLVCEPRNPEQRLTASAPSSSIERRTTPEKSPAPTPERRPKSRSAPASPEVEAFIKATQEANRELVNTFTDATKEIVGAVTRPQVVDSSASKTEDGKSLTLPGGERVSILTGFDYKPQLPKLPDSETDREEH